MKDQTVIAAGSVVEPLSASTVPEMLELVAAHPRAEIRGLRFADAPGHRFLERPLWTWQQAIAAGQRTAVAIALLLRDSARSERVPPRVGLVLDTGVDFFEALFAVWFAGALPVALQPPPRFGDREAYRRQLAERVALCAASLVLVNERSEKRVRAALEALSPPDITASTDRITVQRVDGLSATARCARDSDGEIAPPIAGREGAGREPALVQFSSGTTGQPKPLVLSSRALLAQARLLGDCWPNEPGQVHSGVSWLPLHHDMGFVGCLLPALARVEDLTLLRPETFVARPAAWLRALSETRATVSPAPNFAYDYCVRKIRDDELAHIDLSAWRTALNGSERVQPSTLDRFWRRFSRVGLRRETLTPAYGLAEAGLAVTMAALESAPEVYGFRAWRLTDGVVERTRSFEIGSDGANDEGCAASSEQDDEVLLVSCGAPLPGFEVRIMSEGETHSACEPSPALGPDSHVGRVAIRGPSMTSGWLTVGENGDCELSPAPEFDREWFDTGDRGFLHRGQLFLLGRDDEVLVIRGRNLPAFWFERAACSVPTVEAAVARPATSPPTGERGPEEAVEVLFESSTAEAREVHDQVRSAIVRATGLQAAELSRVRPGTLPRTSSGKVRRNDVLANWNRFRLRGNEP